MTFVDPGMLTLLPDTPFSSMVMAITITLIVITIVRYDINK